MYIFEKSYKYRLMKIFLLSLLFVLFSCNVKKQTKTEPEPGIMVADTAAVDYNKVRPHEFVDLNSVKVLKEVYVTSLKGAEIFEKNGDKAYWGYPFGTPLSVINENDSLLGVLALNKDIITYVKKKDIGTETEIPLSSYYLNLSYDDSKAFHERIITENEYWDSSDNYTNDYYDKYFNPDDYKDIEVNTISKKQFREIQATVPKLFSSNTAVKKINGIISIGKEQFKDSVSEYYSNIYTYLGEYPSLGAYVLQYMCSECEDYSYEVIEKTTGKTIGSYENFPYYSPDFKTIMCLGQLFSDSPTIMSVFKMPEPSAYIHKEFGSWIPVGDSFWGLDGYFYTEAIPYVTASAYYNDNEKRDAGKYNFRYLKIKIKGPSSISEEE